MLIVDYDALSRLSNNASKLAKHAESYAENLTNKVIKRFDDLAGGGSTYTADAKYYVKAKVRKLQEKQVAYENLSSQIVTFSDKARRIDDEVARMLTRNQENFLKKNEHLRVDEWKAKLLNFLVDLKNKFPVLEMIGNVIRMTMTELSSMWDNIQYWYQCQGGKEILSFVGAIALAIVSVLIFVASLPASGFFAICAAIGAAIGVLNAVTNLVTSFVSMLHALNGDPGWAKVYGDMDNLTDWLRKTNFKNGTLNRLSNGLAFVIDAVELFTAVVGFVEFGKKLITKLRKPNFITNFFSSKTGLWSYCKENVYHEVLDYDEFGNIIGTKWVLKADAYGYVETKFTPKSIWNGMKAFVLDKPVSTSNGQGIFGVLVVDDEGTVGVIQIVDPFTGNSLLLCFQVVEDFCNISRSAGFHIDDGHKIVGLLGLGFIEVNGSEAKAVAVEGTFIRDHNVGHLHLTATVQGVTGGVELDVELLQTVEVHLGIEHLVIERCLNTGTALAAFQIGEPFVPHSVDIPDGIDLVDFDSHSAHLPQGL